MKINLTVIISGLTLLLGLVFGQPYLWVPVSVLLAGLVDLFTRSWVASNRLGRAVTLSVLLKFLLALIGFYAMIGQVACVGLVLWWFAF
jgi:hypothetical protein